MVKVLKLGGGGGCSNGHGCKSLDLVGQSRRDVSNQSRYWEGHAPLRKLVQSPDLEKSLPFLFRSGTQDRLEMFLLV